MVLSRERSRTWALELQLDITTEVKYSYRCWGVVLSISSVQDLQAGGIGMETPHVE